MSWLYYLIEANIYLAVFYGFYRLFLHNETFYSVNRYYLILCTLISFSLPFLQIGYFYNLLGMEQNRETDLNQIPVHMAEAGSEYDLLKLVSTIAYLAMASFLAVKLMARVYKLIVLALNAKRTRHDKVNFVELNSSETAFSFFNLLFINPAITEKETILKHEMVHIRQKHSLDILFFEFIQIINWFNPVTHFIKKDIKLVHEYIADDITTKTDIQKHDYAMFLIQNSFGVTPNQLTNQIFNQSILKRRINMLNQKRSGDRARLKLLLVLPIVGGMLCASTMAFSKDYTMLDLYPEKYEAVKNVVQDTVVKKKTTTKKEQVKFPPPKVEQVKFPPPIVKKNGQRIPPPPPIEPNTKTVKGKQVTGKKIPEPKVEQVRFPPPIVTRDGEELPPPPPVEPDSKTIKGKKASSGVKKDQVILPPPPPIEPNSKTVKGKVIPGKKSPATGVKKDQVKFPPPIVKPIKREVPPPPIEPKSAGNQ
ncbi:BlaR1 peptidase M56 [Pedobacter metabolipauper]|uniref:BlaR1 peptidase M56 n=2 Tax=Pedobacter metabolipauper TaxID=425513 RepID=A0A4R6SS37_9SPHI|nr:BlaR1 peptidase M56 [Pedobacter metabolipauper]